MMKVYYSYGKLIKKINDTMEKEANNSLRNQGLTLAQLSAMIELNNFPQKQASMKDLERILHVAQSTTAGIVARLEQKGMVEGFGDPSDKRIKMVRITLLGEQYLENTEQQITEAERKLLSGLTETEQNIFYSLLEKISDTIK